jgi:hypothetical protein
MGDRVLAVAGFPPIVHHHRRDYRRYCRRAYLDWVRARMGRDSGWRSKPHRHCPRDGCVLIQLSASGGQPNLWGYAAGAALFVPFNIALLVWSRRHPTRDPRLTPFFVRLSFALFVAALLIAGGALLLKMPNVMPWPLKPESSVMIGWIFIGDAFYFIYGLAIHAGTTPARSCGVF